MGDLAATLLRRRPRTVAELAEPFGIDTRDKKRLAAFEKECRRLVPDIKDRLRSNDRDFKGISRCFPDRNPYKEGSLLSRVWDLTKKGDWLDIVAIQPFVVAAVGQVGDETIAETLEAMADPWHKDNQGRSFMLVGADHRGDKMYRMEYSVPEPVMDLCERAWGRLPSQDKPSHLAQPKDETCLSRPTRSPGHESGAMFDALLADYVRDDDWLA
jgi:hypothetical protein